MAESPSTYFPDFRVAWVPQRKLSFKTEVIEYPSGRQVRRQMLMGLAPGAATGQDRSIATLGAELPDTDFTVVAPF